MNFQNKMIPACHLYMLWQCSCCIEPYTVRIVFLNALMGKGEGRIRIYGAHLLLKLVLIFHSHFQVIKHLKFKYNGSIYSFWLNTLNHKHFKHQFHFLFTHSRLPPFDTTNCCFKLPDCIGIPPPYSPVFKSLTFCRKYRNLTTQSSFINSSKHWHRS